MPRPSPETPRARAYTSTCTWWLLLEVATARRRNITCATKQRKTQNTGHRSNRRLIRVVSSIATTTATSSLGPHAERARERDGRDRHDHGKSTAPSATPRFSYSCFRLRCDDVAESAPPSTASHDCHAPRPPPRQLQPRTSIYLRYVPDTSRTRPQARRPRSS